MNIYQFFGVKTTIIHPATELLVKKYTPEPNRIFEETAQLYSDVTKPHINQSKHSLEWVYNILDHKSEVDRIVFEDPDPESGFILLPDLKWDGLNLEGFYLQALPFKRGLRSIRDLTGDHLPLLRKIADAGPRVIQEKYNINKSQLLLYFHYLPSFYHIHVHFKLMQFEGNAGTGVERAHLLATVIQNLEICPNYYQRATLSCSFKSSDDLLKKLEEQQNASKCDNGSAPSSPVV